MGHHFARLFTVLFCFLALPVKVFCCEGDCITGITNAYVGNFSVPVYSVISQIANEIVDKILLPTGYSLTNPPIDYLSPILSSYNKLAPSALEFAIFPNFFHGKCLLPVYGADGTVIDHTVPPGCPKPDCPVVCGTPGSMVHFFPKLRYIAFNATRQVLRELGAPGSESYKQVEEAILRDVRLDTCPSPLNRRALRFARRGFPCSGQEGELTKIQEALRRLFKRIGELLKSECGGLGEGRLRECSWEEGMKRLILSYP
ncbi:hypothetical protein AMATHDRAFT_86940 [Amanita thiersii Skay4041]|uniref:Uncharacterized protein n=1 Tax=Amanita thiersii Skay4041 TaxID=703135 RepID=A0A2A9NLY4_9AGAR|nr:hypothetical protein AMATHDRAFT_86940 [Amanita thiersii Skay4041]